jgi:hypothetical protein
MADFIGGDPASTSGECPALFIARETGDWLVRGKTITDPAVGDEMSQHTGRAEDESVMRHCPTQVELVVHVVTRARV